MVLLFRQRPRRRTNSLCSIVMRSQLAPPLLREPRSRGFIPRLLWIGSSSACRICFRRLRRVWPLLGHNLQPLSRSPKTMSTSAKRSGMSRFAAWCRAATILVFGSGIENSANVVVMSTSLGNKFVTWMQKCIHPHEEELPKWEQGSLQLCPNPNSSPQ